MYELSVGNASGELLRLTNDQRYTVVKIDGLDPPNVNLNISESASYDGGFFNSARLDTRNIVIEIRLNGDIEASRNALYEYFLPKQTVRVYYKNGIRNVYEDGYVETFECGLFEMGQTVVVSIICPVPYWCEAVENRVSFSSAEACFEFPFSIPEEGIEFSTLRSDRITAVAANGAVPWGMVIMLDIGASVTADILITNKTTGQFFCMTGVYLRGETVYLNTVKGQKEFRKHDINSIAKNMIANRGKGSSWLELAPGDNEIEISASRGLEGMTGVIRTFKMYWGV